MASRKRLVFISHSGKDTWVARQIEREVAARGAATFLDYVHIEIGEQFEVKIIKALNRADELLMLLTPWSLDHPYIWSEAGVAWGRQIPIIGILHGMSTSEFLSKPNIPTYLKADNLQDLNGIERYFEELAKRTKPKKPSRAKAKRR
ncbi:MAG TPA: toll/interleukin-1 receptor domain-containing protein [Pyrinomonadaceae bacterium]|nr:toll/interleukin-1 receptor domain-containing protein [Pyrinomonadaceae bacterium]